jgi:hypothetical protein
LKNLLLSFPKYSPSHLAAPVAGRRVEDQDPLQDPVRAAAHMAGARAGTESECFPIALTGRYYLTVPVGAPPSAA